MVEVRVTEGTPMFIHGEDRYDAGDTFDADESVLEAHPNSLEEVDGEDDPTANDTESTDETGGSDGEEGAAPFDPGEFTVDQLESRMADNDYSDAGREALVEAERNGEDRDSAVDVLEA